jgi:hypothetical protein
MSRVSDTRQRTREAATQLVAAGKRPHEITVDLIYAEIQQGSRTTINDELKAWKDERTKADALGADLPPAIADSMRLLWVAAVEQGEQVFLSRRAELETALENAQAREAAAIAAHDVAEATGRELAQRIEALQEQSHDLQRQLGAETAARKEAQGLVQALQEQLTAIRVESARQLEVVARSKIARPPNFRLRSRRVTLRSAPSWTSPPSVSSPFRPACCSRSTMPVRLSAAQKAARGSFSSKTTSCRAISIRLGCNTVCKAGSCRISVFGWTP